MGLEMKMRVPSYSKVRDAGEQRIEVITFGAQLFEVSLLVRFVDLRGGRRGPDRLAALRLKLLKTLGRPVRFVGAGDPGDLRREGELFKSLVFIGGPGGVSRESLRWKLLSSVLGCR